MKRDYPAEYDDVFECDGCGDEFPNIDPNIPEEPLLAGCCGWECYAISLKVDLDSAKRKIEQQRDAYRRERSWCPVSMK